MSTNQDLTLSEFYDTLISPLEGFYHYEKTLADSVCFVQPYPDGTVVEYSWKQVGDQVRRMAAHLKSLNLAPRSNVGLMSANCAYWIMTDIAIWMAGHVSVPLFPVLAEKTIRQTLEHSEVDVMFAGKLEGWEAMKKGVPEHISIISFPLSPSSIKDSSATWKDILQSTEPMQESPVRPIDELGTIIYTSGSTGMPKGVMHSFKTMAAVGTLSRDLYNVTHEDRKISYLSLAHAAERVAIEVNQLYCGYTVYFSDSLATFADDLRRASPTIFFAVPRIWTKFQQRVLEMVDDKQLQMMLQNPEQGPVIKEKLLKGLGFSELRVAVSGASPLSTSLIDWYKGLGIEMLEGYAMSENFSYCHTTKTGEAKTGYVGSPSKYVDFKLSDEGEILARSPANMMGYYKEPELTAQTIDSDGFLHTGDKGQVDDQNRLKITGRVKELFKTSKGKYVAPAPIEDILLRNQDLELVCVTGADLTHPLALILLNEQALERLANDGEDALTESLTESLKSTNAILDKHENLCTLVVLSEEWSVDNGLITPTLKIKRNEIDLRYKDKYQEWADMKTPVIFV